MGESKLKKNPDWKPIPEDLLANDIWMWIKDNQNYSEGTIGYCHSLADYLRLKGHAK
jgi:hypothetical protein